MSSVQKLRCVRCGCEYSPTDVRYVCPACGNDGILEVLYDYDRIRRVLTKEKLQSDPDRSMWRYLAVLPVEERPASLTLQIGWTPLYASRRVGPQLGLDHVWFKDDGRNPTASLKDRASAIAIAKAAELDERVLTAATTGNAGSSLAGLAANAGLTAYIFAPASAPAGKIAQLRVFGSHLFLVDGNYDQAFDLCMEATERFGWYNRNTAFNPYMVEGKKTVALEIAEQLHFEVPDKVIVPVGDGCIVSGVAKGFRDLLRLGLVDRVPQLIAVQAEGCAPIARAVMSGDPVAYLDDPTSCADSIVAGIPRNHLMAVRDIRSSGGLAVTVSDDEIIDAIGFLGRNEGVFAEPAAAASVAALRKLASSGDLHQKDRIAVLITGNGLKDVQNALKVKGTSMAISPHITAVEQAIAQGF
ncbi:MAG TPA: threonine synthase [Clostridia bacterium]|nr:threonine synthase [Clostridia bacterium]